MLEKLSCMVAVVGTLVMEVSEKACNRERVDVWEEGTVRSRETMLHFMHRRS